MSDTLQKTLRRYLAPATGVILSLLIYTGLAVLLFVVNPDIQPPPSPYVVLALDISANMAEPGPDGTPKVDIVRGEALTLLRGLAQAEPQLAVIAFDDTVREVTPLSGELWAVRDILDYPYELGRPDADIGAALKAANELLEGHPNGYIVLITNSKPTGGLPTDEIIAGPGQEAAEAEHCFYTLDLGNADRALLDELRELAPCPQANELTGASGPTRLRAMLVAVPDAIGGYEPAIYHGTVSPESTVELAASVPLYRARMRISVFPSQTGLELRIFDPQGKREKQMRQVREGVTGINVIGPQPGGWTLELANPTGVPITYTAVTSTVLNAVVRRLQEMQITLILGAFVTVTAVAWTSFAMRRFRLPMHTPGAETGPVRGELVSPADDARFPLGMDEETVTCIGSDPACEIHLDDPALAPRHASIHYAKGKYFLEDEAGATRRNGEPVSAARLTHGDKIMLGKVLLRFEQHE